jgi:hypothetical protein
MKKYMAILFASLCLLLTAAATSLAEIKEVRLKVGGYLCGN